MPVTDNKNLFDSAKFKVTIDDVLAPNTAFFCKELTLPGLSVPETIVPFRGEKHRVPGDSADWPPLDIQFMVDEDLNNYRELFAWITSTKDEANQSNIRRADIIVHMFSSKNILSAQMRFVNAFPSTLGALNLNPQTTDVQYSMCDASFQYDYADFI